MLTYILVALGLAMDAFAVSISSGICIPDLKPRHSLRAAGAFGLFQFAMPIAGWYLGSAFSSLIQGFDHWIAFGLLGIVGGKMIVEFFERKAAPAEACAGDGRPSRSILTWGGLLLLAVATSIDALAVGLSYSVLGTAILLPAAIIGIVTFALSLVGCEFGKRIGARFERWAGLVGGIVLVGIGAKILVEHLSKAI
jgi:putative Mn2+ efflux pump MntP